MNQSLDIRQEKPSIMWVDLNSAFATTEQQAHPSLRGKPVGVTNRISKECCVIAASYEAKHRGVKVGCRRSEALKLCPDLVLLETDPPKYHYVYSKLISIMKDYTDNIKMRSIDEGILDFHGTAFEGKTDQLIKIGYEIKRRVREEIGEYMMINVGIGPNRFLAKTAAGLHKPDGLDVITHENLKQIYASLELKDLNGIARGYSARLKMHGITTPLEFLNTPEQFLKKVVFKGINGTYWYKRLRGYEVDSAETKFGMVGRQWVVKNPTNDEEFLQSSMHSLTETVGAKLRYRNAQARGVCVWMGFSAGGGFSDKKMYKTACYTNAEIWRRASELFDNRPKNMKVRIIGMYLYGLEPSSRNQFDLFGMHEKADNLTKSLDDINEFYGMFTVYSADAMTGTKNIKQKIPFGGTKYFDLLLKK